jgi:hypothetical protein
MFSARLTDPHRRRGKRAFDAVVVDEAQDVAIPELRFLAIAGSWRADGLFLTRDLGQRIFQQPFSWKSLGVDIRGRSYTLRLRQAARIAEIIIVKDRHGRAVVGVHWGAALMRFENLIREHDRSERLLPDTPRLDGSRTVSARAVHVAAGVDLAQRERRLAHSRRLRREQLRPPTAIRRVGLGIDAESIAAQKRYAQAT